MVGRAWRRLRLRLRGINVKDVLEHIANVSKDALASRLILSN